MCRTRQAQEAHLQQLRQLRADSAKLQSNQSGMLDQINTAIGYLTQLIDQVEHNRKNCLPSAEELQRLGQQISKVALSQDAVAGQQAIMKSLCFETRSFRHLTIPEAHQNTFGWVYQPEIATSPTSAKYLAQWLRSDDNIFWVSGKPGSGKSTFMKFVADHPRSGQLLSEWSGPKRLVIAGHYFWSAGTTMQKSEQGLLRTLLYEVFRQCPELAKPSCDGRCVGPSQAWGDELPNWTMSDLHATLRKIATQESSTRFCFFIDGLDEFDGQHDEICRVLKDLAKSTDIKLCISSRPWNVFEEAFGDQAQRKLYMQDLTRDDILKYIRSRLYEHPRWPALAAKNSSDDWLWLIHQIEKRACGVFLWVVLVIRLLLQGLTNRDRFSDICRRLESFPVELGPFFRQILESVEPFYHNKMSTTLQMAIAVIEPLPAMSYAFHDQGYDEQDYIFHISTQPYRPEEDELLREEMIWWLNSRTRGLLEVDRISGLVTFLHRTVMDFLKTREMSDFLAEKAPAKFNLPLTLLKVYTATIKRSHFSQSVIRRGSGISDASRLRTLTANTLTWAKEAEKSDSSRIVTYKIIEELDCSMPQKSAALTNLRGHRFFREELITAQFIGYLTWKLPQDSRYLSGMIPLFILHILCPCNSRGAFPIDSKWRTYGIEMLRLVLETQSLDPIVIESSWAILMQHVTSWPRLETNGDKEQKFWKLLENNIPSLFLQQGADPNALNGYRDDDVDHRWPVLERYLNLAFQIPADAAREDLFLRTLVDFINAGATARGGQMDEMRYQPGYLPEKKLFFNRLWSLKPVRSPSCNVRLLADVVDILLSTVDDIERTWLTKMDRKIVEEVFPANILEGLRARHPAIPWKGSKHRTKECKT